MEKIELALVSPEKVILEDRADLVVIPGIDGDIGAMSKHSPIITTLRPGVVHVYNSGKTFFRMFIEGGIAEITPNRCTIMITNGMFLDEINIPELEKTMQDLIEDLSESETIEEQEDISEKLWIVQAKITEHLYYKRHAD